MSPETYEIELRYQDGASGKATVELFDEEACRLTLRSGDHFLEAAADDFFEAFSLIRSSLMSHGCMPVCYGASRNVYPSGMSRQMGGGVKAYRLELGRPGRSEDLVFIFDQGPDVEPVSPEEQRSFYDRWIGSLKARV